MYRLTLKLPQKHYQLGTQLLFIFLRMPHMPEDDDFDNEAGQFGLTLGNPLSARFLVHNYDHDNSANVCLSSSLITFTGRDGRIGRVREIVGSNPG